MPHLRRVCRRHDPRRSTRRASGGRPAPGRPSIGFTESKITKVLARGNRQVPEVAYAVCDRIGMKPKDLDMLVTNQPNRVFLRNWREALELPAERHCDTFEECGNLFGAGIPINFDRAVSDGRVKAGRRGDDGGLRARGRFRRGGRGALGRPGLMTFAEHESAAVEVVAALPDAVDPFALSLNENPFPAAAGRALGADHGDRHGEPVSGIPAASAARPDRRSGRGARGAGGARCRRDGRGAAGAALGDQPRGSDRVDVADVRRLPDPR